LSTCSGKFSLLGKWDEDFGRKRGERKSLVFYGDGKTERRKRYSLEKGRLLTPTIEDGG